MSAGGEASQPQAAAAFSLSSSTLLQSSILTLATLTLLSFTYFSYNSNSLHSPPPPTTTTTTSTSQLYLSKLEVVEVEKQKQKKREKDDDVSGDVYHLPQIFGLNYAEMERRFKVYIYPDGDPNTFYQTPRKLTGKYASEGYFFQNIRDSIFRTHDPNQAHLFFIPISCHKMRGKGTSYENMTIIIQNYVESLISKYPYWNRTLAGGNDIENRTTLGFWAGHRNSKIRVILARVWQNDTELDISNNRINRAIGPLIYQKRFYNTKFCICPGGSQVNSARIADSIHYGCVPVILSNHYDLPFNDILDWHKFAVILKEHDVYQLKQILKDIPDAEFVALHKNIVKVQRHFQWNSPPIRYDAFHMVMYELWLRRNVIKY
ncbi:hypothetical protein SO802_025922 [Lithocarpus litseifolius]|uniref:Exostosin GT47 domain-containing protein n=1 Tax=Lithocarpus litseifolius TaxID=425828 RepID=A0AAW2C028_9ROSI